MMGREHLHNLAHLTTEVDGEQSVKVRVTGLADPHQESLRLSLQLANELGLPAPQISLRVVHYGKSEWWPYVNTVFLSLLR
ncbi:uncharacterized protein [Setaria viridis]|uniref:uncharacterized protein isoform X2 n=1 Tax=Setaria viridis TaxID=4556 RepID=UPI003B3BD578